MLSREVIIEALTRLGRKAAEQQLKGEIAIFGGTGMMLAYNARSGTKDVDAIFRPREKIQALADEVAAGTAYRFGVAQRRSMSECLPPTSVGQGTSISRNWRMFGA